MELANFLAAHHHLTITVHTYKNTATKNLRMVTYLGVAKRGCCLIVCVLFRFDTIQYSGVLYRANPEFLPK